jgi:hypothetical protein
MFVKKLYPKTFVSATIKFEKGCLAGSKNVDTAFLKDKLIEEIEKFYVQFINRKFKIVIKFN